MDILDFFPFGEPREGQKQALRFFEDAVFNGFKDIVIEAPTGIGKSAIGVCASYWMKHEVDTGVLPKAYYLVTQKLLQTQLETDIKRYKPLCSDGKIINSATGYKCQYFSDCAAGARVKGGCLKRRSNECPYIKAKTAFLESTLGVTNYSYFFSAKEYTEDIDTRSLVVLDECHNLEDQIIRHSEGTVTSKMVDRWAPGMELPKFEDGEAYVKWLKGEYGPMLAEYVVSLAELIDDPEKSKDLVDADSHMCKINRTVKLYEEGVGHWIYWEDEGEDPEDRDKKVRSACFRALKAAPFYQEMISHAAPIRLHLSAYPGSKEIYCKSLGLKPSQVAWLTLPSTFLPSRRPIIAYDVGSMSSGSRRETMQELFKYMEIIFEKKQDRGIIHCGTYDIGRAVVKHFSRTKHASRLSFPEKADARDPAVERHTVTKGSILISPSMVEGFDFKDDLARWQIICKVPYLYLGDKQVAARAAMDSSWYQMRAVMSVIQASGRICRNELDSGITYILDSDFKRLYDRNQDMFPSWFKEAVTFK